MSANDEVVMVEIRAAEGGADAKLLVTEQMGIYVRIGERRGL
jgi:protein subunit release factor A